MLAAGRLADVLSAVGSAVVIVDEVGAIQFANAAGRSWLFEAHADVRPVPDSEDGLLARLPANAEVTPLPGTPPLRLLQPAKPGNGHDPISGLATPGRFFVLLEQALRVALQTGAHLAVVTLRIDVLERVGAFYGRDEAHAIEAEAAARLRRGLRRGETATRLDAGVFALFSVAASTPEAAFASARRWVAQLSEPFAIERRQYACRVKAGLAFGPEHGRTPMALLDHAAAAAMMAGKPGESEVVPFSAQMADRMQAEITLEHALVAAIESGELSLAYQPKFVWSGQRPLLVGAEALARWNSPSLGAISPARFIPIAESAGLMGRLGEVLLDQACEDWGQLRDQGLNPPPVAVNLSGLQLAEVGLRDRVAGSLQRHGLRPQDLQLEITESALLADVDYSVHVLKALRGLGVSVAIDDFGTGYSSLAYLRRFPADLLKIDRSFVKDLGADPQATHILKGIIDLARALSLDVIAEGVETPDEREQLLHLGCHHFQGYLFGRPVPLAEFQAQWLTAPTAAAIAQA